MKNLLSPCSLCELKNNNGYYHAAFAEELIMLTVTDTQLDYIGSGSGLACKDNQIAT